MRSHEVLAALDPAEQVIAQRSLPGQVVLQVGHADQHLPVGVPGHLPDVEVGVVEHHLGGDRIDGRVELGGTGTGRRVGQPGCSAPPIQMAVNRPAMRGSSNQALASSVSPPPKQANNGRSSLAIAASIM